MYSHKLKPCIYIYNLPYMAGAQPECTVVYVLCPVYEQPGGAEVSTFDLKPMHMGSNPIEVL
jgi:hypothetical protein